MIVSRQVVGGARAIIAIREPRPKPAFSGGGRCVFIATASSFHGRARTHRLSNRRDMPMPDLETLFLPLGQRAFRFATGVSVSLLAGAAVRASRNRLRRA